MKFEENGDAHAVDYDQQSSAGHCDRRHAFVQCLFNRYQRRAVGLLICQCFGKVPIECVSPGEDIFAKSAVGIGEIGGVVTFEENSLGPINPGDLIAILFGEHIQGRRK